MKETFKTRYYESVKIGSMYDEDVWQVIRRKSGIDPSLEERYAVCYEMDDDNFAWVLAYTDDPDYELSDGQFLVDTETLQVVNQYDLKGYFDRMHQRLRDNLSNTLT